MAEYMPINPSEIEPEAPLTSSLGARWSNNPIAIAEGAPGAPRIQTNAIANGAVTAAKLATGNQERNWVLSRVAAAPLGAVGTYASLALANLGFVTEGQTLPGSELRWCSTDLSNLPPASNYVSPNSPAGTWMCLGRAGTFINTVTFNFNYHPSIWLRIA